MWIDDRINYTTNMKCKTSWAGNRIDQRCSSDHIIHGNYSVRIT